MFLLTSRATFQKLFSTKKLSNKRTSNPQLVSFFMFITCLLNLSMLLEEITSCSFRKVKGWKQILNTTMIICGLTIAKPLFLPSFRSSTIKVYFSRCSLSRTRVPTRSSFEVSLTKKLPSSLPRWIRNSGDDILKYFSKFYEWMEGKLRKITDNVMPITNFWQCNVVCLLIYSVLFLKERNASR